MCIQAALNELQGWIFKKKYMKFDKKKEGVGVGNRGGFRGERMEVDLIKIYCMHI